MTPPYCNKHLFRKQRQVPRHLYCRSIVGPSRKIAQKRIVRKHEVAKVGCVIVPMVLLFMGVYYQQRRSHPEIWNVYSSFDFRIAYYPFPAICGFALFADLVFCLTLTSVHIIPNLTPPFVLPRPAFEQLYKFSEVKECSLHGYLTIGRKGHLMSDIL